MDKMTEQQQQQKKNPGNISTKSLMKIEYHEVFMLNLATPTYH